MTKAPKSFSRENLELVFGVTGVKKYCDRERESDHYSDQPQNLVPRSKYYVIRICVDGVATKVESLT